MSVDRGFMGVHPESAISVDIPNVINLGPRNGKRKVWWPTLAKAILKNRDLQGATLTYAAAYSPTLADASGVASTLGRTLKNSVSVNVQPKSRSDKDIDSLIINDIRMSVVRHQQDSIRDCHLWLPLRVRHIIVSGDHGYLRAYQSLAETYGDDLERELVVYSWRDNLNYALREAANAVHYLDDLVDFTLPAETVA